MYVWKAVEELVPNPGIQLVPLNEKKGRMCTVPFSRNNKRTSTFQVSGAKLFNSLRKEIRNYSP